MQWWWVCTRGCYKGHDGIHKETSHLNEKIFQNVQIKKEREKENPGFVAKIRMEEQPY